MVIKKSVIINYIIRFNHFCRLYKASILSPFWSYQLLLEAQIWAFREYFSFLGEIQNFFRLCLTLYFNVLFFHAMKFFMFYNSSRRGLGVPIPLFCRRWKFCFGFFLNKNLLFFYRKIFKNQLTAPACDFLNFQKWPFFWLFMFCVFAHE